MRIKSFLKLLPSKAAFSTPKPFTLPTPECLEKCSGCGAEFHEIEAATPGYFANWSSHGRPKWLSKWKAYMEWKQNSINGTHVPSETEKYTKKKTSLSRLELERIKKRLVKEGLMSENTPLKESLIASQPKISPDTTIVDALRKEYPDSVLNDEAPLSKNELSPPKVPICERCYHLTVHSRLEGNRQCFSMSSYLTENATGIWGEREKEFFSKNIHSKHSIIALVLDCLDFPASLSVFEAMTQLIPENVPLIVIMNKVDLLPILNPIDFKKLENRVQNIITNKYAYKNILATRFISAKTGLGITELVDCFMDAVSSIGRGHSHVFLIGATNVGKSSLWNGLFKNFSIPQLAPATCSPEPGTTLGILSVPLSTFTKTPKYNQSKHAQGLLTNPTGYLFDTPGIFVRHWIPHYLNFSELQHLKSDKPFKANNFILSPGKCLFLGGLIRIDYESGNASVNFFVFAPPFLPIHVTSNEKADEVYKKNLGLHPKILRPPIIDENRKDTLSFPPLKEALRLTFSSQKHCPACKEILFSGIGWLALSGNVNLATVVVRSPNGQGVFLRDPPLFPFAVEAGLNVKLSSDKKKYFKNN